MQVESLVTEICNSTSIAEFELKVICLIKLLLYIELHFISDKVLDVLYFLPMISLFLNYVSLVGFAYM